ncbi:hypothetical protein Scep_000142 [Stephania cephalantha]|uniref:Cytochrome P450 n=1 Tax=Stephania cephalantha TaxID=152367 RepID=A0AAP0Q6D7_9MAGN
MEESFHQDPWASPSLEKLSSSDGAAIHSTYGSIFRTSLAGKQVVVSSDPNFIHFILQQEGKLVDLWYMETFTKIIGQDDPSVLAIGSITKYFRTLILNHFGIETTKNNLLPRLEALSKQSLSSWSSLPSINVKEAVSSNQKMVLGMIKDAMKRRRHRSSSSSASSPEEIKHRSRDALDDVMEDMKREAFLTDDFSAFVMFGLIIASSETISASLSLAIKLLTEHPLALKELRNIGIEITRKDYVIFGGGLRVCPGAEFSKAFIALFLHAMVTNYTWKKIKGGDVVRDPALTFKNDLYIQVSKK